MSCHAAVVVRSDRTVLYLYCQFLFFPRQKTPGFGKSRQCARRFSKFSLGCLHIDLHNLFSCRIARVLYADIKHAALFSGFHPAAQCKGSIGKPEAKGIKHLLLRLPESLKIAIAHINIFRVPITVRTAEIRRGRIILHRQGDRIRQLAAGIHPPHQHLRSRMSAFHTALPYI